MSHYFTTCVVHCLPKNAKIKKKLSCNLSVCHSMYQYTLQLKRKCYKNSNLTTKRGYVISFLTY